MIEEEIKEAKVFLEKATYPGVRGVLEKFISESEKKMHDEVYAAAPKTGAENEGDDLLEPAPLKPIVTAPPPPKLESVVRRNDTEMMNWIEPSYGWEQGEYNSPWVTIFVNIENVGQVKDQVTCDFGVDSFDLRALGVDGTKNYRLVIEALDKDIVPDESEIIVKKNRIKIKLKKIKGEYSYEQWLDLKKKGGKAAKLKEKNKDPSSSIMDLMKDMYESGDDKTRKIIAESMMKSRRGEKIDSPGSFDDFEAPSSPSADTFGGSDPDL
mmetsp:Transcript_17401/g.22631  ORF Transcript_17401/g.22631 Transcript_17401/m.22631 type:complete len:268 (+) Transcript_17401:107-910(+)|eukprot:CAMPEP_0197290784 /NCGR_PEP_ID=MMETSP0890-20130614/10203_1 /TAXON_ID=44058 ORGANISM="Aureoumbra lagunensis, Strain CCMP1510" /NCGR_SAMPLE_ID=MMETSP0890 /ASSEMBLY_ACC=CAM_ASM_000533 /LENGTH=267 /DNA_ID=CAMNT_0042763081 /DNA_START=84 /DNA_END=887 /DNA_ORIENTATION=+